MSFRRHLVARAAAICLASLAVAQAYAQGAVPASVEAARAPQTLTAVLADVLGTDPQVRVARSAVDVLEARARQLQSRYWPTAGLNGAVGESTDREFNVDVQRHTERLEAVLRWNLYNGGSDRVELEAIERDIASARYDLERARSEAAERIADAWLEAQRLHALASASRQRLDDVTSLARQVEVQGAAGRVAESDVMQAQSSLSEAQVSHDLAVADAQSAMARLEALTSRPLPGFAPAGMPAPDPSAPVTHALLKSARARAEAASLRQRKLAEALAPRLDVEVRQSLSDRTHPVPTTLQRRGALLSMTWEMPLGGETLARRDETARRAEAARADADRIELLLGAELAALRHREAAAARAVDSTLTQVEQSRAIVRAGQVQFEAGRRSVQQLVQSREAQFGAEQRYIESQARLLQVRMKQWSASGGLLAALGLGPTKASVGLAEPPRILPPATAPAAAPGPVVASTPPGAPAVPSAATPAGASPPPVTAAPKPSESKPAADALAAVAGQLARWQAAWKSRDVEAYLGFYARDFSPAKPASRAQWEAHRRRVLGQAGAIELDIDAPQYDVVDGTVVVTFTQRYQSPTYRDTVRKRVEWVSDRGQWRIRRESVL